LTMESSILDVIIGLVLIYATLALLVTAIQEMVVGGFLRSRVGVLHQLVNEAVSRDTNLKRRLLNNPLVSALYRDNDAEKGLLGSSGPSAISPDVFARALLMEFDSAGGGVHPAERFATPQAFLDAQEPTPKSEPERNMLKALRGLAVGCEEDWGGFENAIKAWFQHIGDRSEGWFKRRSSKWSFLIALGLAVALNVDSLHIAQTLSTDAAMRSELVGLAQQAVARGSGETTQPLPDPAGEIRPEVLISARLMDAYNRLRPLYFDNEDIARYTHNLETVSSVCAEVIETKGESRGSRSKQVKKQFISDARTWMDLIPALLVKIELALVNNVDQKPKVNGTTTDIGEQQRQIADPALKTLESAQRCLTHVSAWVRAATTASKDPAVQRTMQDVAVAIEDSKWALDNVLRARRMPIPLLRLFQAAPDAYANCLEDVTDISTLRQCVSQSIGGLSRLPLGWMNANMRTQICGVVQGARGQTLDDLPDTETVMCAGHAEGVPALGLRPLRMKAVGWWAAISWLLGILVTTFAVALGAPFWFDSLGKLVRIRSAGRTREMSDNVLKAKGTQALPTEVAGAVGGAPKSATRVSPQPFSTAQNAFEERLTRREIIALQQRIGVVPASGDWNDATRLKLRQELFAAGLSNDGTLTAANYAVLVGRPPAAANVVGAVVGARPRRGAAFALAPTLAQKLNAILKFPGRVPENVDSFTDELRALTVLYRYKSENKKPPINCAVFSLARDTPAALDEVDEKLLNEMLMATKDLPRDDKAPWMDWAVGELGQKEKGGSTRGASNPRVCEFLDSVSEALGDKGDATPWCGAFVHWVLSRQFAGGVEFPDAPASARSWIVWGAQHTDLHGKPAPIYGDVVVFEVMSSGGEIGHHVGFCMEQDENHIWVLGGNQGSDRVKLSKFNRAALVAAGSP
jgi:uncharacterized protein (TIGR02594 family)